jgi:dienelactone hydrolase
MSNRIVLALAFLVTSALAPAAHAKVKTEIVIYTEGTTTLEGVLAYDDAVKDKRPGVVIVHDWMGMSPYWQKRAEDIAALGTVAFAADIYGKGVRPKDGAEAGKLAGQFKNDRALLRARVQAAFAQLVKHPLVDATRTAGIGYCFGGTTVLELARAGAPVSGVVSFHGGLQTPTPADAKSLKAKVLVLHGADDPHVKPAEVSAFKDEMRAAKADWQLVEYSNAVHAFTVQSAGNDPSKGAAYNADADRRSWRAMRDFFDELFVTAPKK